MAFCHVIESSADILHQTPADAAQASLVSPAASGMAASVLTPVALLYSATHTVSPAPGDVDLSGKSQGREQAQAQQACRPCRIVLALLLHHHTVADAGSCLRRCLEPNK